MIELRPGVQRSFEAFCKCGSSNRRNLRLQSFCVLRLSNERSIWFHLSRSSRTLSLRFPRSRVHACGVGVRKLCPKGSEPLDDAAGFDLLLDIGQLLHETVVAEALLNFVELLDEAIGIDLFLNIGELLHETVVAEALLNFVKSLDEAIGIDLLLNIGELPRRDRCCRGPSRSLRRV